MPACITHNCFAKKVLKKISPEKASNIDMEAFYWGAQGPDFFFCHKFFQRNSEKSLNRYSYKLHREKPSVIFSSMRKFIGLHPEPIYISYVYGFVCHYVLDAFAHPYVEALTNKLLPVKLKENRSTLHGEIEASLETIILRRETGKLPTSVKLKDMFPKNQGVRMATAKLYSFVLEDIFGDKISEENIFSATSSARFVFAAATDRTTLKKKIFDRIENKSPAYISSHIVPLTEDPDIDYANISKEEWEINGKNSHESFFELFDNAANLAAEIIDEFDFCDFAEITEEKPFWCEPEGQK